MKTLTPSKRLVLYKKALKYFEIAKKRDDINHQQYMGLCSFFSNELKTDIEPRLMIKLFPEIWKQNPLKDKFRFSLRFWWDIDDYDSRINALKKAIKSVNIQMQKTIVK